MADSRTLKVFIAEDHQLTRLGLHFALEHDAGFELVGEASEGRAVVDQVLQLKPDIVLMDIELIGLNGCAATQLIKQKAPNIRIIILTSYDDDEKVFSSFTAGADGYCLKSVNTEQLVQAIREVWNGHTWIDPAIAGRVLAWSDRRSGTPAPRGTAHLSARELDVLRLVVEGMSNPDIARKLCLSPETVKTHMRHIMEKLSAGDRTQAAVKAMRQGLI